MRSIRTPEGFGMTALVQFRSIQKPPRDHTLCGLHKEPRHTMISLLIAMSMFAMVGAITPGPVNVLAVRHGAAQGLKRPLSFVLGASVSYALVVWLMGTGAQHLVQANPALVQGIQWLGAAYLLYLAWALATTPADAKPAGSDAARLSAWKVFGQGFATQALNPKAWLVAFAGVSLFVLPQVDTQASLVAFCLVSLLACLMGVGCWAALGRSFATWLETPERQVRFNRALALLLAINVAGMLRS